MARFILKVKILNKNARIDYPAYPGDCGYDIYAMDCYLIKAHTTEKIPLGIALEFPDKYFCEVNDRSSIASCQSLISHGNIIDSSYRGECHIILSNLSDRDQVISGGTKIGQFIFRKYEKPKIIFVDELKPSMRNKNGFGSTNKARKEI